MPTNRSSLMAWADLVASSVNSPPGHTQPPLSLARQSDDAQQSLRLSGSFLPLLQEGGELGVLRRDPIGRAVFVRRSGICRCLFDQLTDVVSNCGDALVEFDDSGSVSHGDSFASLRSRSKKRCLLVYNMMDYDPLATLEIGSTSSVGRSGVASFHRTDPTGRSSMR